MRSEINAHCVTASRGEIEAILNAVETMPNFLINLRSFPQTMNKSAGLEVLSMW